MCVVINGEIAQSSTFYETRLHVIICDKYAITRDMVKFITPLKRKLYFFNNFIFSRKLAPVKLIPGIFGRRRNIVEISGVHN